MNNNLNPWRKVDSLITKLRKIGIELTLVGNCPWIYLISVNGKSVKERYLAEHGFTIAWYPTKPNYDAELTDIGEIFKVIRKYL